MATSRKHFQGGEGMKLRTKIQALFGGTVILATVVVGAMAYFSISNSAVEIVSNNMTSSAELASHHISDLLFDYENTVTVTGKNKSITEGNSDAKKIQLINEYVEIYGFTSGNVLDVNGVSIEDGTDFSDRDYVIKALQGETNISEITLSKLTNKYGISIAAPIVNNGNTIEGVVYFRLDIDFLQQILDGIKVTENSYAYIVDKNGTVIVHPDTSLINNYNMLEQDGDMVDVAKKITAGENGFGTYTYEGMTQYCGYCTIDESDGWSLVITAPEEDVMASSHEVGRNSAIVDVLAAIIAMILASSLAGYISKPINKIMKMLTAISNGDFSQKIEKKEGKDEIAVLQTASAELHETLSNIISEANGVLGSISEYNLDCPDMKKYPGEFNSLAVSVNSIKNILNRLIYEIQNTAAGVETGSSQLADAASALADGTVAQASSIQKLVEDVGDVAERINRNSENGSLVNEKLMKLDTEIKNSSNEMRELQQAVKEIEEMSADIQKIVNTIDSIAFQTNILALNASVEAARAGDNGKGFAVVADEVGSLAAKCGDASKKTADLIEKCIHSINHAKGCADTTFESLTTIVAESAEISNTFGDISSDTLEQAGRASNIKQEITNISDVVQSNTATAEETAASTEVLSQQAMNLEQMIKKFKVKI